MKVKASSYLLNQQAARMASQADEDKIYKLYKSLKGMTFHGSYEGVQQMHDKEWELFDIQDGKSVIKTLQSIHKRADGHIWKGFTGPEDCEDWDYRLYADFEGSDIESGEYKILDVKRFNFRSKPSEYQNNCGYAISIRSI